MFLLPRTALAVLIACSASAALAQTAPSALLTRLDTNGDGSVSAAEMQASREATFARLDANGDDVLDAAEIAAMRDGIEDRAAIAGARVGQMARQLDADGDGKISRVEFSAPGRLFAMGDRDGDGVLSPEEFERVAKLISDRRG